MKTLKNKIMICLGAIALLFVCSIEVNAQEEQNTDVKKIELGVRYMPTFSALKIQTYSGGTIKGEVTLGHGFGALVGYNFSNHIGIQAEVIYNSISQKFKEDAVERKINLRYINIPLLLSLNTNKSKLVNVNFVVGPQIGISVGGSVHSSGGSETDTLTAVLSVKKGDIGVAYGAGIDIGLNNDRTFRLGLGFRGVYGLIDISDDSETATTNSYYILGRTHLQTYSGYIGISFLF